MPEEIIFDENIKGKVQVESLSELEDYVEHENVKRNATITKITRTIGKIIIMARKTAVNPDAYCLDLRVKLSVGCKRRSYFFFLYLPVLSYLRL